MNPSPNFLIIGAQKSGTTSLYEYLKQHPDVLMSNKKETEFLAYDKFYLKGFNYYEKFFSGYKGQKCVGEASTDYSNYVGLEKTIKRIYDFNKNMKLIYILRNPISRAYSAHFWRKRQMFEKLKFEQALELEETRKNTTHLMDPFSYKRMGLYYKIISKYLKYFNQNNFQVVLFDDLIISPEVTCNKIFDFLDIDEFSVMPLEKKQQNPVGLPKNEHIQRILGQPNKLTNTVGYMIEHSLGEQAKRRLYHFVIDRNIQETNYPPMREATFQYLLEYFEDDIKNLEKFLNRDLTSWKNSRKELCG